MRVPVLNFKFLRCFESSESRTNFLFGSQIRAAKYILCDLDVTEHVGAISIPASDLRTVQKQTLQTAIHSLAKDPCNIIKKDGNFIRVPLSKGTNRGMLFQFHEMSIRK